MEMITVNGASFLNLAIRNVTQPKLRVPIMVRTTFAPEILDRMEKIAWYMADQCQLLIPFFYETRNDIPRGRMHQMMVNRMRTVGDETIANQYRAMLDVEEFDYSKLVPLARVVVQANTIEYAFCCAHDPEFTYFKRRMEIPFSDSKLWAEVEAYNAARIAELEALSKKSGGEPTMEQLADAFEASFEDEMQLAS